MKKEKIGEGVYGKVYKGVERSTNEICAMKRINFNSVQDGVPSSSLREVALLKSLTHPNIVNLRDVMYVGDNKIYMIMDYVESNLQKWIKDRDSRDDVTNSRYTQSYLYQLLRAVNFCHFNRILHRDIKPANILLDGEGNLKLADFGLGRCFNIPMMKMTHEIITLYYRAPEILLGADYYSMPVDIWSIGTIFAEMVTGSVLFKSNSEIDALFRIFRTLGTPTNKTWPGVELFKNYKAEYVVLKRRMYSYFFFFPLSLSLSYFQSPNRFSPNHRWFPKWFSQTLEKFVPGLRKEGVELLSNMLKYQPGERFTAREALLSSYFKPPSSPSSSSEK